MFPYKIGHYFKDQHQGHITGLDFDRQDSQLLVACSDDGQVSLYDALRPQHIKTVKVDNASLVRFTHHPSAVLVAANNTILYTSLHDNQCLRKYSFSNASSVNSLSMSPNEDVFLASTDASTCLWDLRASKAIGSLSTKAPNVSCYDPQGQVFALASESRIVRLFDARNYDKGPFASFEVVDSYRPDVTWSAISFSPDGSEFIISTKHNVAYVLDSFEGTVKSSLNATFSQGTSFSADNRFIVAGCQDGSLAAWDRVNGAFEGEPEIIEAHHRHVSALNFNQRHNMFVSACTFLAFWIPGSHH
jgi:COMPASS component SWD2